MGRNREFDINQALDAALFVFWKKGYEGTSYTDLTQATGVKRPALYSAFGNKEALFLRVLERYYEHYHDFFPAALELPTSREVVARIFRGAAKLQTRYPDHKGCLYVHGDLAGSDESEPIRRALVDARADGETSLRDRFERAKQEGDLPENANCAALAAFVMAVLHGMAVQAKAGFSRNMLEAVAEQALSTWPAGSSALSGKSS
jgi:AcrR family transcriptional regulator